MQAVEVAEREHRMHQPGRPRIIGKVQDVHAGYDASTMASSTRPSYASSTPAGRRALVWACPRSCAMCVKYARRGAIFAIAPSASSTLKCVGCFLSRRASMTSVSTRSTRGHDWSGMALQSVEIRETPKAEAKDRHVAVEER